MSEGRPARAISTDRLWVLTPGFIASLLQAGDDGVGVRRVKQWGLIQLTRGGVCKV
jgi:hypothetical protein